MPVSDCEVQRLNAFVFSVLMAVSNFAVGNCRRQNPPLRRRAEPSRRPRRTCGHPQSAGVAADPPPPKAIAADDDDTAAGRATLGVAVRAPLRPRSNCVCSCVCVRVRVRVCGAAFILKSRFHC